MSSEEEATFAVVSESWLLRVSLPSVWNRRARTGWFNWSQHRTRVGRLSLLTTQRCNRWFLQQNSTTQVHMQEEPDSLHHNRQEHWTRPSAVVRRDSQKKRIEVIDFSSHVDVADSGGAAGQFKMPRCVKPSNAKVLQILCENVVSRFFSTAFEWNVVKLRKEKLFVIFIVDR